MMELSSATGTSSLQLLVFLNSKILGTYFSNMRRNSSTIVCAERIEVKGTTIGLSAQKLQDVMGEIKVYAAGALWSCNTLSYVYSTFT